MYGHMSKHTISLTHAHTHKHTLISVTMWWMASQCLHNCFIHLDGDLLSYRNSCVLGNKCERPTPLFNGNWREKNVKIMEYTKAFVLKCMCLYRCTVKPSSCSVCVRASLSAVWLWVMVVVSLRKKGHQPSIVFRLHRHTRKTLHWFY